jgi:hypothetical protein
MQQVPPPQQKKNQKKIQQHRQQTANKSCGKKKHIPHKMRKRSCPTPPSETPFTRSKAARTTPPADIIGWRTLPSELWLRILCELLPECALLPARMACREWREMLAPRESDGRHCVALFAAEGWPDMVRWLRDEAEQHRRHPRDEADELAEENARALAKAKRAAVKAACESAAALGCTELLHELCGLGIMQQHAIEFAPIAAREGHMDALRWMASTPDGSVVSPSDSNVRAHWVRAYACAISHGRRPIAAWLEREAHPYSRKMCTLAVLKKLARCGDMEELQNWRMRGTPYKQWATARLCGAAAAGGQLGLLKWLFDICVPVNQEKRMGSINIACERASFHGKIHVLQWLAEQVSLPTV